MISRIYGLMILLMQCPLTPDYSRAGAVPATQRTSHDPAFFSAPDPTHYREYIYYHMTTPHQAKSGSPRFRAKCARPLSFVKAGSGNKTKAHVNGCPEKLKVLSALCFESVTLYFAGKCSCMPSLSTRS